MGKVIIILPGYLWFDKGQQFSQVNRTLHDIDSRVTLVRPLSIYPAVCMYLKHFSPGTALGPTNGTRTEMSTGPGQGV